MKKVLILALAAGVSFSMPVVGETYNCKIDQRKEDGWIPSQLVINHNPRTGKVIVNDEIIMHFLGKPIAGSVVANNDKRITFRWVLPEIKSRVGQTAMRFLYKASYLKKKRRVIVTANPTGYDNDFRGAGTCSVK